MNRGLCIFPSLFLLLMGSLVKVASRFPFDDGRHVVLNPTLLTWDEAVSACNEMNGTLLTVYDAGTLIDIGIERKWIAWVGLKTEADDGENTAKWNSGEWVTWSNWANPRNLDRELCTVAVTIRPYEWTPVNCSTKWPSLCELHNGTCHFEVSRRSSLAGFNNDLLLNIGVETCRQRCESSETFYCMSFEYNSVWQFCQLSETHRWNEQAHFAFPDKEWNYYHRQCYTVYLDDTWIPNGEIVSTTDEPHITSTTEATTHTIPEETTKDGFICVKIDTLQPNENQTEEIRSEIKELQDLSEVYKDRRRSQRKESATDPRPSARYLGSVALSITLCLLIIVIVLDLLTFTRHCPGGKAKHKHKVNFKRQLYQDFGTAKVIRLTPTWPSSVNTNPDVDHYSCPADLDDVEIRLNDDVDTSNKADFESLDVKALNRSEENSNSYVSWPYDKSSPVLYPFHRSASEKAHREQRSPHSLRVTKTEKYPRSQSDSFFNKRIFVLPESKTDWQAKRPGLTKTDHLVMAYGHHFDSDDATSKFYRSLKVGKLRRGSHC